MAGSKVIFIIPGFRQKPTDRAYQKIASILKSESYFPILIDIEWKNSTISQNCQYFLKVYKKAKARKKYILGFSYGAMIALLASTKVSVSGLILCSLSPYFKEDMPKINKNLSLLMASRYRDFSKLHCAELAKKIKAKKILMLYGGQETTSLVRRVRNAFEQIPSVKKHLIRIPETKHEIGNKKYLSTIHEAAKHLLYSQ